MALQKFKAESKRLLDLMINSIYTHKEIFLRELISNASDAIDKLYYRSLTDGATGMNTSDFRIEIHPDKTNRTLTISDNGCGMTREDLVQNLGTIADSGTFRFKEEHAMDQKETEIIGQFGVGFYSAFMVAKRVTVVSRAYGAEEAYQWKSEGAEGFSVSAAKRDTHGTDIILELKDDTEDEHYSEYLEQYRLTQLIKKYSSYIRYPIQMELEKSRKKEDSDEYETYTEVETINSMVPLWKRQKSELTESDYNNFYTDRFSDYEAPLRTIHTSAEGAVSYNALLFIPSHAPYDYYSKAYEKGLQLYANGVLIMDKCADLLPDYFSFVRGLVDSPDLSLNISREMLQHDRQLKVIASNIEKKIKSELLAMLKNDREKYETFFRAFGLQLKYGTYMDYGMHSELLRDLLLFHSMKQDKLITLQEYVDAMPEGQTAIYYAAGETIQRIKAMPQLDRLEEKGYDVLFLTDDVDEFALTILHTFAEKEFKSVTSSELSLETEEEKKASEEQAEASKPLLDTLREALSGKVKDVRLSSRLKNHAVCLSSDGPLSIGMEKVLNAMPVENKVKADRVLELNADHPCLRSWKLCKRPEIRTRSKRTPTCSLRKRSSSKAFCPRIPRNIRRRCCSFSAKQSNTQRGKAFGLPSFYPANSKRSDSVRAFLYVLLDQSCGACDKLCARTFLIIGCIALCGHRSRGSLRPVEQFTAHDRPVLFAELRAERLHVRIKRSLRSAVFRLAASLFQSEGDAHAEYRPAHFPHAADASAKRCRRAYRFFQRQAALLRKCTRDCLCAIIARKEQLARSFFMLHESNLQIM